MKHMWLSFLRLQIVHAILKLMHKLGSNMVITVLADALASTSARPSAG